MEKDPGNYFTTWIILQLSLPLNFDCVAQLIYLQIPSPRLILATTFLVMGIGLPSYLNSLARDRSYT